MELTKIHANSRLLNALLVLAVFSLTKLALGQNIGNVKPIEKVSATFINSHRPFQAGGDSNTIVINYDSADAAVWGAANYVHNQMQLMNTNYVNPTDSSAQNYNVINYFAVAFDSLIDPYTDKSYPVDSVGHIIIDTVIVPIVQVNHSGTNDTLDVQLNSVNAFGYPTASILKEYKVINAVIGDLNSNSTVSYIKVPESYNLSAGTKFAVTVKYSGAKVDSCWFIYGYGSFVGACGGFAYTLAELSSFSKVETSAGSFFANSFVQYNAYQSMGYYPTNSGSMLYYNCIGDTNFTPGADGASYFQNINVYTMVTTVPVGIDELTQKGISLGQNYPNPYSGITQISYSINALSDIGFSVSDITGRILLNTVYTKVYPGQHVISINSEQFTPGVYFYSLNVNGASVTKKMVVLR